MHTVFDSINEDISWDDDEYCLYYQPIVMHFAHLEEQ